MADNAKLIQHPDEYPFVGPPGPHEDGTVCVNEDSGEAYFWDAQESPPKWVPLR